jgi:hypothetical protein
MICLRVKQCRSRLRSASQPTSLAVAFRRGQVERNIPLAAGSILAAWSQPIRDRNRFSTRDFFQRKISSAIAWALASIDQTVPVRSFST